MTQRLTQPSPLRRQLLTATTIALSTAAYGIPFGALGTAAGLSVWQTQSLSLLMYGGASQIAMASALLSGASLAAACLTALLLSSRTFFYSVAISRMGVFTGPQRVLGAHLISDESAAATTNETDREHRRTAFWVTGLAVFAAWNLSTLVGALAGQVIDDPRVFGLDAIASAALLALVAPQLRSRNKLGAFVLAGVVGVAVTPFTAPGVPILVALLVVIGTHLAIRGPRIRKDVA